MEPYYQQKGGANVSQDAVIPEELIKAVERRFQQNCPDCNQKLEAKKVLSHHGCGATSYYFCKPCKRYFRDHQGGEVHNPSGFRELCPNPKNDKELKEQMKFDAKILGVEL